MSYTKTCKFETLVTLKYIGIKKCSMFVETFSINRLTQLDLLLKCDVYRTTEHRGKSKV